MACARPGVVADSCGRAAGKAGDWCRKGCCWGPARPCDPLYSCHNLGTFGAAPNGAPGRPAPPGNPRPPGTRPARRSPRLERRPGRPWSGSVSGRGSVARSLGSARLRASGWSDCAGSRAPRAAPDFPSVNPRLPSSLSPPRLRFLDPFPPAKPESR